MQGVVNGHALAEPLAVLQSSPPTSLLRRFDAQMGRLLLALSSLQLTRRCSLK